MEQQLLFVLHAVLDCDIRISSILRLARQARPSGSGYALLLLCDLPDAGAAVLPEDAPMLRRLQSGVMSMNAKSGGFLLLVRKRTWDDASRAYLGENQRTSCRHVVAQLLHSGSTDAAFAAATVSPASLKGRFSHVLFSDCSLSCTPDTFLRMKEALSSSPSGCVCAPVFERNLFPQTALTRLCRAAPFSLSPFHSAAEDHLRRKDRGHSNAPTLYTADALKALADAPIRSAPAARGCFFVRRHSRTLPDFFAAYRQICLKDRLFHALFPPFQISLLFAGAAAGLPWFAALAILPAELWALCHPRMLPGALLRLSLLPLTACVSLDALLCRTLARSRLLRLRIPDSLITPQGCMLFAAILLSAAMHGAQALAVLLPICLLWFAAPLIAPALDSPTLERIPLSGDQRKQLRSLAESAFFDSENAEVSQPMRMLFACCGCMLGLLEPDEAARRVEAQLSALSQDALSASSFAAMLSAAQFLREHMRHCDAALRNLPAQIEAAALALPLEKPTGRLGLFLSTARGECSSEQIHNRLSKMDAPEPLDLLFLPLSSAKDSPVYPLSLPLTHPHTFLKRRMLAKDSPVYLPKPVSSVLFFTAAALNHPFHTLLEHSPITGPYMPLLFT